MIIIPACVEIKLREIRLPLSIVVALALGSHMSAFIVVKCSWGIWLKSFNNIHDKTRFLCIIRGVYSMWSNIMCLQRPVINYDFNLTSAINMCMIGLALVTNTNMTDCNRIKRNQIYSFFTALAAERFIGTFQPLRYPEVITMERIKILLLLIIFLPTVVYLPLIALGNRYRDGLPCILFLVLPPWYTWATLGVMLICIVLTTLIYLVILRTAIRLQKEVRTLFCGFEASTGVCFLWVQMYACVGLRVSVNTKHLIETVMLNQILRIISAN